ncbi:MAG: hypothetical protein RLP09_02465, partial [Sandaracinaceae bacterium]
MRRADAALEHAREERLWKIAKRQQEAPRGNAVELHNQLDRVISGMHTSVAALDRESPLAKRCREFLATYFPQGAGGITNREFEDQLGAMKEILAHSRRSTDSSTKSWSRSVKSSLKPGYSLIARTDHAAGGFVAGVSRQRLTRHR